MTVNAVRLKDAMEDVKLDHFTLMHVSLIALAAIDFGDEGTSKRKKHNNNEFLYYRKNMYLKTKTDG